MRLPDGYVREEVAGAEVVARADVVAHVAAAIREAGSLYDWAASRPEAVPLAGRGPVFRVPVDADLWMIRHYRRGGAVADVLGDRYVRGPVSRPVRELEVSVRARRLGIRTPVALAAVTYPAGAFYRADLATEYVNDAEDLAAVSFGERRRGEAELAAAWRAAGELVRAVAAAGLRHPDLNLKNILIAPADAGPMGWLIDLDRARIGRAPDVAGLEAMVRRLHRSRRKLEARSGERVTGAALRAFDEALRG